MPAQRAVGLQRHPVGQRRRGIVQHGRQALASEGLSITSPISVFSLAERGSKLNEPTKIFLRSTAKVFACSPAVECLPISSPRFEDRRRARLELEQLHAGVQQILSPLGVAGMHRHLVGAGQRIGQHPHPHAASGQRGQRLGALLSGHEVRRHQIEVATGGAESPGTAEAAAAAGASSLGSSVFAGSSCTTRAVVHSNCSVPADQGLGLRRAVTASAYLRTVGLSCDGLRPCASSARLTAGSPIDDEAGRIGRGLFQ